MRYKLNFTDLIIMLNGITVLIKFYYSTVTDLAKFLGWSTSVPLIIAT